MSLFNKLFGKKDIKNYNEELTNIILDEVWTKKRSQAIALADTLILNMGYIEAEEYVLNASARYKDSSIRILAMIKATTEGIENIPQDAHYVASNILVADISELMQQLISSIDDLTKLVFQWGDVKSIFIKEIKVIYPNFQDESYDEVSEKLMEYLCFNIQIKNGR